MGMMGIVGVLIFSVIIIVIMVMVVMLIFFVMMMFLFFIIIFIVVVFAFHCFNPGSGGCHFVEVKHLRVQDFVEVHVAVVAFDDFRLGLDGAYNLLDA